MAKSSESEPTASGISLDARQNRPLRGIALTVIGIGCITVNDALMKSVIDDHPVSQAIFVRGMFAFLPILFIVLRAGGLSALRVHSVSLQLWCALLLTIPIFLFIYSLSQLPLSIATIIFFTNPLFVTLLAPWFIGEGFRWRRGLAVMVGFIGTVLIVSPGTAHFEWIFFGPLAVAFFSAARDLVVRKALARETSASLLFYSSTLVTVLAAATLPLDTAVFGWKPLSHSDVGALALTSCMFCLGIYLMTEGLRFAQATLLSLYKYSAIIWALLLGYLFWDEIPTTQTWLGAALIVASGLYTIMRSKPAEE